MNNVQCRYSPTGEMYKDDSGFLCMNTQYRLEINIEQLDYKNKDIVLREIEEHLWNLFEGSLTLKEKREEFRYQLAPSYIREQELEVIRKQQKKDSRIKEIVEQSESVPNELKIVISDVVCNNTRIVQQWLDGNDKSINSLVGQVMKQYKFDAATIKMLLEKEINSNDRSGDTKS